MPGTTVYDAAKQAGIDIPVLCHHPKMQPVGMYFTMSDVDVVELAHWARQTDDVPAQAIPAKDEDLDYGLWLTGFNKTIQAYKAETNIDLPRENITLKTANGLMYVNATRVLGVNVFSPTEFSAAVVECYRQIEEYARFLIAKVPGFSQAKIAQVAPVLGVREIGVDLEPGAPNS